MGVRVLVVDDQQVIRGNLRLRFERLGCTVAESENAFQALSVFSSFRPHIITLDIAMPAVDSFTALDLLRHVRNTTDNTEVVVITSIVSPAEREQFLKEGAIEFLCKPFDSFAGLVRKVEPLIRVLQDRAIGSAPVERSRIEAEGTSRSDVEENGGVDAAVLKELRELTCSSGDTQEFAQLIEVFLAELELRSAMMRKAVAEQNLRDLACCAHSIRGASHGMGAKYLASLCGALEETLANGQLESIEPLFNRIQNEIPGVQRQFEIAKTREFLIDRRSLSRE